MNNLTQIALAGTAKVATEPKTGTALDGLFAELPGVERERALLLRAAAQASYALAGQVAQPGVTLPAAAPDERLAICAPSSGPTRRRNDAWTAQKRAAGSIGTDGARRFAGGVGGVEPPHLPWPTPPPLLKNSTPSPLFSTPPPLFPTSPTPPPLFPTPPPLIFPNPPPLFGQSEQQYVVKWPQKKTLPDDGPGNPADPESSCLPRRTSRPSPKGQRRRIPRSRMRRCRKMMAATAGQLTERQRQQRHQFYILALVAVPAYHPGWLSKLMISSGSVAMSCRSPCSPA